MLKIYDYNYEIFYLNWILYTDKLNCEEHIENVAITRLILYSSDGSVGSITILGKGQIIYFS